MKKRIVIISLVAAAVILAGISPFAYKKIKLDMADKALTKEYEAFIAANTAFYKNSYLNDIDISGKTVEEAARAYLDTYDSLSVLVEAPGFTGETLSYKSLSKKEDTLNAYLKECFDGQTLTRDEYLGEAARKDYSINYSDVTDFEASDYSGLSLFDESKITESEDAYATVDTDKRVASITEEVYGNRVIKENFIEKLTKTIGDGTNKLVLLPEDFVRPSILSSDEALNAKKDYLNTLLTKKISISVCGVNFDIGDDSVIKMLDFENEEYLNDAEVENFVNELSKKYDTYGKNRSFVTSTGAAVSLDPGDFGWKINCEETIATLKECLVSESASEKMNASYKVVGQRPANNEFSNTYVEISLENQKIWMYVDGALIVYDDVTTGETSDPQWASHTGVFKLKYKATDKVLRGPTWEDFVYYWMSFDGSNGMHDATWRNDSEFGGSNRNGNGSHGCTNLRLNTAETVYNNIRDDTPIIVW